MLRLCLAIMCRDEAPLLRLHAPVWTQAPFDGWVALDGGSTDESAAVCQSNGFTVYHQTAPPFPPVGWENELVERVEALGFSHIFRLDADELVHPEAVASIRQMLERDADAVRMPRYNFMGDRRHYADQRPFYPDIQLKVWKLGCGVRYRQVIDSVPDAEARGLRVVCRMDLHLYHYSYVKPMAEYLRKRVPLERQARGEDPAYTPPDVAQYPAVPVPFTGVQPLDPDVIGANAPYA